MRNSFLYHKAVQRVIGLAYDGQEESTPMVTLKENNFVAQKVIQLARRYSIPIVERPDLVDALSPFELDQEIPESLFEPVAILLNQLRERI